MKLFVCTALLVMVAVVPAAAKPKHWHQDEKHWNKHVRGGDDDFDRHHDNCYVGPRDVRVVREYYEPRYRSLPPGLAKKYRRTGHLPPGWAKKIEPLPIDVERRLIPMPRGYQRGYVDGALVVYVPSTQVVIDVVPLFNR